MSAWVELVNLVECAIRAEEPKLLYISENGRNSILAANEVVEAAKVFAHDDLCKKLGGNVSGDSSIIFQRDNAIITLGDCRKIRAALNKLEEGE